MVLDATATHSVVGVGLVVGGIPVSHIVVVVLGSRGLGSLSNLGCLLNRSFRRDDLLAADWLEL